MAELPVVGETKQTCRGCRFGQPVVADPESQIRCRRFPPALGPDESDGAPDGRLGFRFPWMQPLDWCGEFQPKSEHHDLTEKKLLMSKPVRSLNLSVRARRCMDRFKVRTIGDLCYLTADELVDGRGFGTTSLNEVRDRLAAMGLKLLGD